MGKRILDYTPRWLEPPSSGYKLFSDPAPQSPTSPPKRSSYLSGPNGRSIDYQGTKKLLAKRGTEIFAVVGNQIRWADLSAVRDIWEEKSRTSRKDARAVAEDKQDDHETPEYRTLLVPVYYQIKQLSISPSGRFLGICTEHTAHIAILPDSSRLKDQDKSPLKLKTHQLGPTIHVIPESAIVSALWHPLAVATETSDCFVTVTAEAAVRVWELDRANHWSFERPTLAIDLRKLADGVSCDEDFQPSGFGKTRGFSVDAFDMEVSAACFGGRGIEEEEAWSSMTLWIAMKNGDVYALCPLLPSKWRPTATTIPSLSTNVVARHATMDASSASSDEVRSAIQQYEWLQEIDNTGPLSSQDYGDSSQFEIRTRPSSPSAIPRLQGPFELQLPAEDFDLEISDIYVIPAKLDDEELLSGEDDYDDQLAGSEGIPYTIVCLATTDEQIYVALDMEGVCGQWLPKKGKTTFAVPDSDTRELVLASCLKLVESASTPAPSWPTFTADPLSPHEVFWSSSRYVFSISLSEWCSRLGGEISSIEGEDRGLQTRIGLACQAPVASITELIDSEGENTSATVNGHLSAPVIFDDPEFGFMVMTMSSYRPFAVILDSHHTRPYEDAQLTIHDFATSIRDAEVLDEESLPIRAAYAPRDVLYRSPAAPLKDFLSQNLPQRIQSTLKQPIKLSPATLDIMTSTHRIISSQTGQVEVAAAELFRRCERLRIELSEQLRQMVELADRLQVLVGGGSSEDSGKMAGSVNVNDRLTLAQSRQKEIVQRYEALRRKTGRVANAATDLSEKEVQWMNEIKGLGTFYLPQKPEQTGRSTEDVNILRERFDMVKRLSTQLLEESKKLEKQHTAASDDRKGSNNGRSESPFTRPSSIVSSKLQKEKIADVMAMVEREGAVIEAVMARLDRLNVG